MHEKQESYILLYRYDTPTSVLGNLDGSCLLLEPWNFRNCRKVTGQFSRLRIISRQDFSVSSENRNCGSWPCSNAKWMQSAGLGHSWWGRCSQPAPFGSCSPKGIFLESRKTLSLASMALSQLFQRPLLNRSLSNEVCCKTCCSNWSVVYLGSVFLILATKQAGSHAGAPGISEHYHCCSFLVLR